MAGSSSVPLEYQNTYLYPPLTIKSIPYFTSTKELSYCQQLDLVIFLLAFWGGIKKR